MTLQSLLRRREGLEEIIWRWKRAPRAGGTQLLIPSGVGTGDSEVLGTPEGSLVGPTQHVPLDDLRSSKI